MCMCKAKQSTLRMLIINHLGDGKQGLAWRRSTTGSKDRARLKMGHQILGKSASSKVEAPCPLSSLHPWHGHQGSLPQILQSQHLPKPSQPEVLQPLGGRKPRAANSSPSNCIETVWFCSICGLWTARHRKNCHLSGSNQAGLAALPRCSHSCNCSKVTFA